MYGTIWVPIIVGVGLAWCLNLSFRENPAGIPITRVALRSLPGIALFMIVGAVLSGIVMISVVLRIPGVEHNATLEVLLAVVTGIAVPQTARFKDRLLTRNFTKNYPLVAGCIQWMDESSRLYCLKIIAREERKLSFELFNENEAARQCAIHRLFEFHLIEIARNECERLNREHRPPEPAIHIFNVRNVQVKLKFFTRFIGYDSAILHVRLVAENPRMIFPTWPPSPVDRRGGTGDAGQAMRKYEQPYVKSYVLGQF